MKKIQQIAAESSLFQEIPTQDIPLIFDHLSPFLKHFHKNQPIIRENAPVDHIGLVISGKVFIAQEDVWGNSTILAQISPGDLFAEAYACGGAKIFPISVTASENCSILFFDFHRLFAFATASLAPAQNQMIENLLRIISIKNIYLVKKMSFLTKRTIREKVLAYLSNEAKKRKKYTFDIPFNRQELANFLAVDRSALSKELSLMKKEGIIQFHKNTFQLIEQFCAAKNQK